MKRILYLWFTVTLLVPLLSCNDQVAEKDLRIQTINSSEALPVQSPLVGSSCSVEKCGPQPRFPIIACADGATIEGSVCRMDADGNCGWSLAKCPVSQAVCTHQGLTYLPGESFDSGDGVNKCGCTTGGEVICSMVGVSVDPVPEPKVCTYMGKTYNPGDGFDSADGCNGCGCTEDGNVICSLRACAIDVPEIKVCTHLGTTYNPGDSFDAGDGCNRCGCTEDGNVICSLIACSANLPAQNVCTYMGKTYRPGDNFESADGCNRCGCTADFEVICSARHCIPSDAMQSN